MACRSIILLFCALLSVSSGCGIAGETDKVTAFSPTSVCIVFNNQKLAAFRPTADDFTRIDLSNSFGDASLYNNTQALFHVESFGMKSIQKEYKSQTSGSLSAVFPLMTAIIHATNGVVDGISWDDGCFFCDAASSLCADNSYYNNQKVTTGPFAGKTCEAPIPDCSAAGCQGCCDLKVYVVWTGTDANGNSLTSAGLRFSRFRQYKLSTLYNSARSFV
jgi:hypothetical protein